MRQCYKQILDYYDNQLNTMNNLTNNYVMLMRQAEQTNSRREAKKLINQAAELRERLAGTFRYDHLDYSGLS